MPNRRSLILSATLLAGLLQAGCATRGPSIPPDYAGPRAQLTDSSVANSSHEADLFVARAVDGTTIESSIDVTARLNAGHGMSLTPYCIQRPLPAGRPVTVGVQGSTIYGAPILAMIHGTYQVEGDVRFTPEAGHAYVVKGHLAKDGTAVWIEDAATHQVVGAKVEAPASGQ